MIDRRHRNPETLASLFAKIACCTLFAALPSTAPGFAAEAPAPQTVATFGEAIEVRRVNVDVVVEDGADRSVDGLGREDFELYEDGQQVEILNFAAYRDEAAPAHAASVSDGADGADGAEDLSAPVPVSWVIYVDAGKVSPGPRNDATRKLQQFLAAQARPQDRLMVAGFDGSALRLLSPLTEDRGALETALAGLEHGSSDAIARRSRAQTLVVEMQSLEGSMSPVELQQQGLAAPGGTRSLYDPAVAVDQFWLSLETYVREEADREKAALRALDHLLGMISGIDGRVALLFVGAPIEVRPGDPILRRAEARFGSDSSGAQRVHDVERRQVDLSPDLRKVFERANASRVTIFTIDATDNRELGINPTEEKGLPALTEGSHSGVGNASASYALAALAESTGGRAFSASPELAQRLGAVSSDLRSYYSLAYEPTRETAGGFHRIEVRLRRPGLVAHYRQGVRERESEEVASDAAVAALIGEPPANSLGLRVQIAVADKSASRSKRKLTPVHIEIPLSSLLLMPDAAVHRGQVDFTFALLDENEALTRTESKRLDFAIGNERLAQALSEYISYEIELPVARGSYRLAVVAVDRISGERSTLVTPFTVAAR